MRTPVFGTNNRILEIDLSRRCFSPVLITSEERIKYLGGKGLALKLLYDRIETGVQPLGEKNIIVFILVVLLAVFIIQNTQVVEVQLLFWKVSMSRALMLLGALVIGFISGWLAKGIKMKT